MRTPFLALVRTRVGQWNAETPVEPQTPSRDVASTVRAQFRHRAGLSISIAFALWSCAGLHAAVQDKKSSSAAPLLYSGNESGTFRIYFSGAEIGQEKFQITESGGSDKATAETRLTIERDKEKVSFLIRPALEFNRFFEPVSYEIGQESGPN